MNMVDVADVIKESNIIVFAPHYDDFPLMMAGYIFELKKRGLLKTKRFTNVNVFSRTNYQLRDIEGNKDTSLARIKFAVGVRLLEDLSCMDELLGVHQYAYRLLGESDCSIRGKKAADSEMEFHHGTYDDLDEEDYAILNRVTDAASEYLNLSDTALVFPIGFKEHYDHFIVREGVRKAAKKGGVLQFYYAEEKPLSGLANEDEIERINAVIEEDHVAPKPFRYDPNEMIALVFKHYTSQVEPVYSQGILNRAEKLQKQYNTDFPLECIYAPK